MTEAEWLASGDPDGMLAFLADRASARKRRLFACACCRVVWDLLADGRSRKAVRKLEGYADELHNDRARRDAYNIANAAYLDSRVPQWTAATSAACVVACAASAELPSNVSGNLHSALHLTRGLGVGDVRRLQAATIRCILGNPFRLVAADPAWLTTDAVGVARAIYDGHAFADLPILADALEDAGCDDADVLGHCRGPGPHARGCWVLDAVLGRK